MNNLENTTLTEKLTFEKAIAKVVNGVQFKTYNNIARYIYIMRKFDKNVKQLRKAIREELKKSDGYIAPGVLQNETAVANYLLYAESLPAITAGEKLRLDFCTKYSTKIKNLLDDFETDGKPRADAKVDDDGAPILSKLETRIDRVAKFLKDNGLSYRTIVTGFKETTETAETAETAETVTLSDVLRWVDSADKKEVENLYLHLQARFENMLDSQKEEKSKNQKAS